MLERRRWGDASEAFLVALRCAAIVMKTVYARCRNRGGLFLFFSCSCSLADRLNENSSGPRVTKQGLVSCIFPMRAPCISVNLLAPHMPGELFESRRHLVSVFRATVIPLPLRQRCLPNLSFPPPPPNTPTDDPLCSVDLISTRPTENNHGWIDIASPRRLRGLRLTWGWGSTSTSSWRCRCERGTVRYGTVRYGTVFCDAVFYETVGRIWYDTVRYHMMVGRIWYDTV